MKNVLIVHDISCYGKCSTTVALPIISSMELSGTLLPTSLLSTHTGPGFEEFTFLDLTAEMAKIVDHWKRLDLKFDGIYIGYLGSVKQIRFLVEQIPQILKVDGQVFLDPVMGDGGNFYYGFDENYAKEMLKLIELANVIMPNHTEASYLYDLAYADGKWTQDQVNAFVAKVRAHSNASIVLTGAGFDGERTGAYFNDVKTGKAALIQSKFIGGSFHGTGDIFGSILTGALMNNVSLADATKLAVVSVPKAIGTSINNPNMQQDGLEFEEILGDLTNYIRANKNIEAELDRYSISISDLKI